VVRAPDLTPSPGGSWIGSEPLRLADLRGRFVLLDFWTFCCANCLHVLDELRPLEAEFADVLTVVGVHSPKFPHEAEPAAVAAAVERYGVEHPVVNDPGLRLWQQYAVRAWPTLVLIDPEGNVVAQAAGEGHVSALAARLSELVAEHRARGTLRPGSRPFARAQREETTLRFPAKAAALPSGTLLVADAGNDRLVELDRDAEALLRVVDGPFREPNGLCLVPPGRVAFDVVVADTANHVLRTVELATGRIGTIDLPARLAGRETVTGAVPGVLSPWDVAWWPALDRLVVAAAGVHLLLSVSLDGEVEILAGTTVEGLRDGAAGQAWLAQPSGLAVAGERLWFVDAETSALRYLTASGEVHTAVGEGLFDFGHVDGPAAKARLQHPLGVSVLADGSVAVLDTYNGAVRRYHDGALSTLAEGLAEPSGAVVLDGGLVVVESAAHRLVRPELRERIVGGEALRTDRPPVDVRSGAVRLDVVFTPPPGRKVDDRYGPATRLDVTASPPGLLVDGAGESTSLTRELVLGDVAEGVLHVTAQAASCDAEGEHPACYLARQDWGIPVRVRKAGSDGTDGTDVVTLILLG
jgi:thiol-disulfide isomerase/thioredoxin